MKQKCFKEPEGELIKLLQEFDCTEISLIPSKLKCTQYKNKRELFYGAVLGACLNRISKDKKDRYLIGLPEKDEAYDCELLNHKQWLINQPLPRGHRIPDHFLIQNVCITKHPVKTFLNNGTNNIYEMFRQHLYNTKLSPRAGDYSGCILIFYIHLNCKNIYIDKVRKAIRSVKQNKLMQIWWLAPNVNQYTIAELLMSEDPVYVADLSSLTKLRKKLG